MQPVCSADQQVFFHMPNILVNVHIVMSSGRQIVSLSFSVLAFPLPGKGGCLRIIQPAKIILRNYDFPGFQTPPGPHIFQALPGIYLEFWPIMEAEHGNEKQQRSPTPLRLASYRH